MSQRIVITIEDDGTPTIETFGFDGPACERETTALEMDFGFSTHQRRRKPEYYHRQTEREKARQS